MKSVSILFDTTSLTCTPSLTAAHKFCIFSTAFPGWPYYWNLTFVGRDIIQLNKTINSSLELLHFHIQVENGYRIKGDALPGTGGPAPDEQKEVQPKHYRSNYSLFSSEQKASENAAYRIAVSENKSFVAAEAFKEKERVSKLADDANNMLLLAQDIYDQCKLLYPTLPIRFP